MRVELREGRSLERAQGQQQRCASGGQAGKKHDYTRQGSTYKLQASGKKRSSHSGIVKILYFQRNIIVIACKYFVSGVKL
jgi:hypothetical protein